MEKNKNILCIVDKSYPDSNANTNCMELFMKQFIDKGFSVDYLSCREKIDDEYIYKKDNSNYFKYDTYSLRLVNKYKKLCKAKRFDDLSVLMNKTFRILRTVRDYFSDVEKGISIDKKSLNQIIDILKKNGKPHYDYIISSCQPVYMHIIAEKLLAVYPDAKWFAVFLDPFVYNFCTRATSVNLRKKVAEKYFSKATKIFTTIGIVQENTRRGYSPSFSDKIIEFSLPSLVDRTCKKQLNKNNIKMTYAGIFYNKIRNPKEMFKVLSLLGDEFEIDLMSQQCQDEINQAKQNNPNFKLNALGFLPREECLNKLQTSNILINLGNTITNQTPSKVFEYIGMGKPVVNFYFDENDTSLYYFKKYPLCFNLNLNNYTAKDVEELKQFCILNKDKQISFEEATVNLKDCISDNVCKMIYDEIIKA